MTIQLELNPEVIERLAAEAKARGIGLEEYAEALLREATAELSSPQGVLSVPDIRAMLAAMAEGAEKLPRLPTSAFTRESYYEERR